MLLPVPVKGDGRSGYPGGGPFAAARQSPGVGMNSLLPHCSAIA
jgi:hypothetical protein